MFSIVLLYTSISSYIGLQNDHKALSTEMESLMMQMHAHLLKEHPDTQPSQSSQSSQSSSHTTATPDKIPRKVDILRPLARVGEVLTGSPADEGGLVKGDIIMKFGGAVKDNGVTLPSVVGESLDKPIEIIIVRDGEEVILSVTPKKWSGPSTLGCHVIPL